MNSSFKTVSIIIPTYNRAQLLGITLESCINQTYPKNLFEIIVVDNNSTDNTKQVIEEWKKKSEVPVKYIFEPRQGAHIARNGAAKQSESEILYFTDDDMIADKNLLVNIVKVFNLDYNVACAGGKVIPQWESDPPEWLLKYFKNGSLSLIEKAEKLIIAPYDMGIYSCHQAVLRDVLIKCGGFNPDVVKAELIGNGETGLNIKIVQAGYSLAYVDDAVTTHIIPPSRMTQKYINHRSGNQGNCDSFTFFRKYETSKRKLLKTIMLSHIPSMFRFYFRSLKERFANKDIWRFNRVQSHYFYHRIKSDFKLATNDDRREFALKYDYLDE